jgi:hypothetical protein
MAMSTMTQELDAQVMWQEALRRKPFVRPVAEQTAGNRVDAGDWWVDLPPVRPQPAPDVQIMMRELHRWTGWSSRVLADALGTSHTTIQSIEAGRPLMSTRTGDLRRRIVDAHDVVSRLAALVDGDMGRLAAALGQVAPDGTNAQGHLRQGNATRAYLAAVDVLRPPIRSRHGLVVGDRPTRPGTATASLAD